MRRSIVRYPGIVTDSGRVAPNPSVSDYLSREFDEAMEDSYYNEDFTEEYDEPMLREGAPRNRTVNPVPESSMVLYPEVEIVFGEFC